MRKIDKFKGLGVALVTPFTNDNQVDHAAIANIINFNIKNGVDYFLLLGTTGESPTVTPEERQAIIKTAVATVSGRVPIVVGIGGNCTASAVKAIAETDLTGVDAILSVTPFYNRPTQEGLIQHYTELAYHSPLPIILYSIKGRTAVNIDYETVLRLAENEKIIGVKEASGNMNQIMSLIKHKPNDFLIISGDDAITLPLMAAGADGLISVVANAFPKEISQMVHWAIQGNFEEARKIHLQMLDITQACFKEGNPSGIKTFLACKGFIKYYLRLPLIRVSMEHQNYIKQLLYDFQTDFED